MSFQPSLISAWLLPPLQPGKSRIAAGPRDTRKTLRGSTGESIGCCSGSASRHAGRRANRSGSTQSGAAGLQLVAPLRLPCQTEPRAFFPGRAWTTNAFCCMLPPGAMGICFLHSSSSNMGHVAMSDAKAAAPQCCRPREAKYRHFFVKRPAAGCDARIRLRIALVTKPMTFACIGPLTAPCWQSS